MLLMQNDWWAQEISRNFKAKIKNWKFHANLYCKKYICNGLYFTHKTVFQPIFSKVFLIKKKKLGSFGVFWGNLGYFDEFSKFYILISFKHSKKYVANSVLYAFFTIEICVIFPALQVCFGISYEISWAYQPFFINNIYIGFV
jgi:hypothetical protein